VQGVYIWPRIGPGRRSSVPRLGCFGSDPNLSAATDGNREVKKFGLLSGNLRTAPETFDSKSLGIAAREELENALCDCKRRLYLWRDLDF
jgi:hypothetical protein